MPRFFVAELPNKLGGFSLECLFEVFAGLSLFPHPFATVAGTETGSARFRSGA
jgi:hypothetical protein